MGKLSKFDIVFANTGGVFYAGNVIQGYIEIELSESMSMRGIKLSFEGKAKVKWDEWEYRGTGDDRERVKMRYKSSQKYFDKDIILHGTKSSDSTVDLPSGRHTFPFEFQLPPDLPSSFESEIGTAHGNIRFLCKCKIDKPWKFDHKVKRPFTVIGILDLNSQVAYKSRLQDQKEKNLGCLCCKSGPISATFYVERQGYVPGEAIRLFAEISNASSRKIDKTYVTLKMVTSFHGHCRDNLRNQTKKKKTEIAKLTHPSIDANSEDSWNGEQIIIPPLPPSFLTGCKIIDVHYILKLSVDPCGIGLNLEVPLEIVIGTIPLMFIIEQNPPMAPALPIGFEGTFYDPSSLPAGEMFPQMPPNDIPNLPPPSYVECVTGKVDIKDNESDDDNEYTRGNLNFAPVYTYYNWGHTPEGLPAQTAQDSDDD